MSRKFMRQVQADSARGAGDQCSFRIHPREYAHRTRGTCMVSSEVVPRFLGFDGDKKKREFRRRVRAQTKSGYVQRLGWWGGRPPRCGVAIYLVGENKGQQRARLSARR